MRVGRTSGQDRDAERGLAGAVVRGVAPEELGLFEETEADYFGDPGLVKGRAPGRSGRVRPRHGPADPVRPRGRQCGRALPRRGCLRRGTRRGPGRTPLIARAFLGAIVSTVTYEQR
jgi:hypothetical protein